MREITVYVNDPDDINIDSDFLGRIGEDDGTQLNVYLPTDWTGSFYFDWYTTEWNEGADAYTDTDITYIVPGEFLIPGEVFLRIRHEDTGTTYCKPIRFEVK